MGGSTSALRRAVRALGLLTLLVTASALSGSEATAARSDRVAAPCLSLERVTAFAPRGEVYVELAASCGPEHFLEESTLLAYVEVLPSDLPPVGEDVRVYDEEPAGRSTLHFSGLSIASGDVVLVRLLRFGEILDLRSVRVP